MIVGFALLPLLVGERLAHHMLWIGRPTSAPYGPATLSRAGGLTFGAIVARFIIARRLFAADGAPVAG